MSLNLSLVWSSSDGLYELVARRSAAGNGARLFDMLRRTNEARTNVASVFQDGLGYL
jgi:hypothetical protein